MPVYDYGGHYHYGGYAASNPGHSSGFSSSYSPYTTTQHYPYTYTSHNNPTTNYYSKQNYPNSNSLSPLNSSGIAAKYYVNVNKPSYSYNAYKNIGVQVPYVEKRGDKGASYTPSPYSTYSLWKENKITAKWRNDKYRYPPIKDVAPVRVTRPLFVDTSKINVNKPRREVTPPKSIPKPAENMVEKIMEREPIGTIKRGRTVVRMHTKMLKENPYLKKTEAAAVHEDSPSDSFNAESRFNRMSPIRISRLKKRSVLQYKRNDSGGKNWLDSDNESSSDSGSESGSSIKRENTVKMKKLSRSGTIKREDTIKKETESRAGTIKRRYVKQNSKNLTGPIELTEDSLPAKQDRRLSVEMYEEQEAILDSLIKEELARKDADDYFSDPKRGTVKIRSNARKNTNKVVMERSGHSTDSADDDEQKRTNESNKNRKKKDVSESEPNSEKSTPSSSRRNSLFQDLVIEDTISESFIEELENKIQNSYSNPEKVLGERVSTKTASKSSQKTINKPTKFDAVLKSASDAKITSIYESDEICRPKTPKAVFDSKKAEEQFKFSNSDLENFRIETDKKVEVILMLEENIGVGRYSCSSEDAKKNPLRAPEEMLSKLAIEKLEKNNTEIIIFEATKTRAEKNNADQVALSIRKEMKITLKETENILNDKLAASTLPVDIETKSSVIKEGVVLTKIIQGNNSQVEAAKSSTIDCNKPLGIPAIRNERQNKKPSGSAESLEIARDPRLSDVSNEKENKFIKVLIKPQSPEEKMKATEMQTKPKASTRIDCGLETKATGDAGENTQEKVLTASNVLLTEIGAVGAEHKFAPKSNSIKTAVNVNVAVKAENEKDFRAKCISESNTVGDNPISGENQEKSTVSVTEAESSIIRLDKLHSSTINKSTINSSKGVNPNISQSQASLTAGKNINYKSGKAVKDTDSSQTSLKVNKLPSTATQEKTIKDSSSSVEKSKNQPQSKAKSPSESKGVEKTTLPSRTTESGQKEIIQVPEDSPPRKPDPNASKKRTVRKSKGVRKASAIMHMKPRAMVPRTIELHAPSLKTPHYASLPKPKQAIIDVIVPEESVKSDDEDGEDDDEEESEEDSSECSSSDDSSDSKQGKQRNSTSSLDSGFGSACYKIRKGIALPHRCVN